MMTKRANKKRWSYTTGEKGRNRVRVFQHGSGVLMLEYRSDGKRKRMSLGHRDRDRAKQQADEAAARLANPEAYQPEKTREELTLGQLFDMYEVEVTPTKADNTQRHDRRTMEMFGRYFGRERSVRGLDRRDYDRFIRDRTAGQVGPATRTRSGGVKNRIIEQDLRLLNAIFNWATMATDSRGEMLLERNPFKGYRLPKEKNPRRVVLSQEEYEALLEVSKDVDWRFHVALVLAHETGHRAGAIAGLRWADVDLEEGLILWRAENEKTGYEHVTPASSAALEALKFALSRSPAVGDAPVMPSPKDPSKGPSRHLMRDWWKRAEKLAGLEPKAGRGWHSLRRKFGSDMMNLPLKVLSELGGWKEPQTILKCYQHPDQDALAEALRSRNYHPGARKGPERAQIGPVREAEPETPKLRLIP
jgi:integrase